MKITDEHIEVAARAIHATFALRATDRNGKPRGRSWPAIAPHLRQQYRDEARAALQAANQIDAVA